jgi:hypothetical protein
MSVPTAPMVIGTRSVAAYFGGYYCPDTISMGRIHGTSPGIAEISITGDTPSIVYGSKQVVQIDGATFEGIVVFAEKITDTEEGESWKIKLVDMRDRLHDKQIFCQLNMLDEHGRWFHILPVNWRGQIRNYVTTLTNEDIDKASLNDEDVLSEECADKLFTAAQLIYSMSQSFNFDVTASNHAAAILNSSIPDNLDWNNGIKVIDAIDSILKLYGLQFTVWGDLTLHISMKGVPDDPYLYSLLTGDPCELPSFISSSVGNELNERGRRAIAIGGPTRVQLCFACKPCWNPLFDAEAVFLSTVDFAVRMQVAGLNIDFSTMDDLKAALPDYAYDLVNYGKWKGVSIGEMTIREYMETFPFRVYAVDFNTPVEEDGLAGIDWSDHNTADLYSRVPISESLIVPSDKQSLAKASLVLEEQKGVYDALKIADDRGYITEGVSLDIDHMDIAVDDVSGECLDRWHVRLQFSNHKYWLDGDLPPGSRPIEPDRVTLQLALDCELSVAEEGSTGSDPRVREITRVNRDIKKGLYYVGTELNAKYAAVGRPGTVDPHSPILALLSTIPGLIELPLLAPDYGAQASAAYADEILTAFAKQMLFHEFITTAGHITFDEIAGLMPDGLIDSVQMNFDANEGVTETANLTSTINDSEVYERYRPLGRASKITGEEELKRMRFLEQDRKNFKARGAAAAVPAVVKAAHPGGNATEPKQRTAFARDGAVLVHVDETLYNDFDEDSSIYPGRLLLIRNPTAGSNQVS